MKKNTLIRRIDDLGRFVLPKDIRKELGVSKGDYLELSIDEDVLHLRKYSCIQNLDLLSSILVNCIHDIYGVEAVIVEEEKIVSSLRHNQKNVIEKLKQEQYTSLPIIYEGTEIGKLILFSLEEEIKKLTSLLVSFLEKYLEE